MSFPTSKSTQFLSKLLLNLIVFYLFREHLLVAIIEMVQEVSHNGILAILQISHRCFLPQSKQSCSHFLGSAYYLVKSVFKAPVPVYKILKTSAFLVQISLKIVSSSSENFSKVVGCGNKCEKSKKKKKKKLCKKKNLISLRKIRLHKNLMQNPSC